MTKLTAATPFGQIARQLRIIGIADGADRIGLLPLPALSLHAMAYFSDALAPVWHLPIIDGHILKRRRPYYPSLQEDIDCLVGRGILMVENLRDVHVGDESWQLEASYQLHRAFVDPILQVAEGFREQALELAFVREVVYATSGLGADQLGHASHVDRLYGDPLVDVGGMIDVDRDDGPNPTAEVALRFGLLLHQERRGLSNAEMIHLYVRQLYSRMSVA